MWASIAQPKGPAWLVLAALFVATPALGVPLTPQEQRAIEQRIAPERPSKPKLSLTEGDTVFFKHTIVLKAGRLRGSVADYEGLVTGIVSPSGVVVHPRLDSFQLDTRGAQHKVHVVYAMHVTPGTSNGGRVQMTLSVVERKGLANVIAKQRMTHWVSVQQKVPSQRDLRADFEGYRRFAVSARADRKTLARRGVKVSFKDNGRMPALNRAGAKTALRAYRFDQVRRRMWAAQRHLVTATRSPNRDIAKSAKIYLANLDTPTAQLKGLPSVSLVETAPPPPPPKATPGPVETLEPVSSQAASGSTSGGSPDALAPVASYDPNSEQREPTSSLPPSRTPRPDPPPSAAAEAPPPAPNPTGNASEPDPDGVVSERSDDILSSNGVRRYIRIPSYNRGLVLDDVNIAHGAAFRTAWAHNVKVRENAIASAFFFEAQAAITRSVGIELTVPVEYVNVDQDRARSVFAMGNPLIAGKWRLYLPEVKGRQPALTLRTRFGLPISPLHPIKPTSLGLPAAEDFSREAHFADTYAFFLEKANVGLGASMAWRWNILRLGAQLYTDYFIPLGSAEDQTDFMTLNWGASVGAFPWGDIVGFFAEARAVSLFAGPGRTEFFTYLGARGRLAKMFEPALWITLPLGSVRNANTFQIGAELRFSYDVYDVVDPGGESRRDVPMFE